MDNPHERVIPLPADDNLARFEQLIVPHLDAAYNLARWLTGNNHDAEDVVQEAYLRALQFFRSFQGTGGRSWLLTVVRNTCYTWLEKNRGLQKMLAFEEEKHGGTMPTASPESLLMRKEDRQSVRQALEALSAEYREVIVLRELEGLSYQEIATIAAIPLGTVMSRLARARAKLAGCLGLSKEPNLDL